MYRDIETKTSYKYLTKVISKLKEPICMLGGWAVFFTVNKGYKKQMKRVYIGSRDIDLGFKTIASYKRAAAILENELQFQFVSFRFYKNVHAETGKDISEQEAKTTPQHMIFPMYVDPIVSHMDKRMKAQLGFTPLDEPMLKLVFKNNRYRKITKVFGKKLLLPTPEVLLATKLNSVLHRDKEHKRQKDICDIVALCLFSEEHTNQIIKEIKRLVPKAILKSFRSTDFRDDINRCSITLGLESNVVTAAIEKIKEI